MAINLPHWLVEIVDFLGFNWPEIDEDQIREAAGRLRTYADNCEQSHNTTHGIVTNDLPAVYQAQSFTALSDAWTNETRGHMQTIVDVCRVLAVAMDAAAVGVEVMKGKVLVQLGIAAAEFAADQAAAAFTFGLAEAAEPALIAIQNKILNGIFQEFEAQIIGDLVGKAIGPATERLEEAFTKLTAPSAPSGGGAAAPGIVMDLDAILTHAGRVQEQADGNRQGGRAFESQVTSLTFTTGG